VGEDGEHAPLVGGEECLVGSRGHPAARGWRGVELFGADDAGGQAAGGDGVDDDGAELLHEVQGEVRPAPPGLVEVSDGRVQAAGSEAARRSCASMV
jgi:hypothetical protein